MQPCSRRVGKCVMSALPLLSLALLFASIDTAIAGGLNVPYSDDLFADIEIPADAEESSELSPTPELEGEDQSTTPTVTVFPTTFNWDNWTETPEVEGITCQSDGFNTVCLDQNQAEALHW